MTKPPNSHSTKERVLIISAHPLFRDGMVRLLGDEVEVVAAVSTWQEAQAVIQRCRPQAIIVDHDDAELKEADLAPLLWPDAEDLRVIYVTLAGDRMTIHDRRQVIGASEVELLRALKGGRWESPTPFTPPSSPGAKESGSQLPQGSLNRMDKSQNRRHLIIASVLAALVATIVALFLRNARLFQPAASAQAGPIDGLMGAMLIVIALLFALIVVFMLYSVVVFRRKPGEEGDGVHFHGNTRLEIAWTILPLITVLTFAFFGARGLADVTATEADELEIAVTAQRYAWQFDYPESGVRAPINQAVVPVDRPLVFKITSIDVIHNFWIPEFRVKQDAVPGLIRDLRIRPTQVGEFKVRCNELCGVLHHAMLATVRVVEPDEYEAWIAEQVAGAEAVQAATEAASAGLSEAAQRGSELVVSSGCTACHNITGDAGGVGPTWKGLFGSERQFADSTTAVADEEYIHNSIVNPNGQVVTGYPQSVMPQVYGDQLSEQEIADIVEYIKSLGQ